jgi:hypothetical protein
MVMLLGGGWIEGLDPEVRFSRVLQFPVRHMSGDLDLTLTSVTPCKKPLSPMGDFPPPGDDNSTPNKWCDEGMARTCRALSPFGGKKVPMGYLTLGNTGS